MVLILYVFYRIFKDSTTSILIVFKSNLKRHPDGRTFIQILFYSYIVMHLFILKIYMN